MVNIWTLPDPPTAPSPSTKFAGPPASLYYFSKANSADLTSLHWSPDGQLLAIGSYDAILRVCKVNGELYFAHHQHNVSIIVTSVAPLYIEVLIEKGPIFATRFSKSGHWLLTASLDGTACLWNVAEKQLHRQYSCHTGEGDVSSQVVVSHLL